VQSTLLPSLARFQSPVSQCRGYACWPILQLILGYRYWLFESRKPEQGWWKHSRYFSEFGEENTKAMAGAHETKTGTMEARVSGGGEAGAGGEVTKKMLPVMENPLVIRTEFSDQATWEGIVAAIKTTTSEGFNAYVEFLDDPAFQGMTTAELLGLASSEYKTQHSFLMVVDHATITEPEHPLLVVDLYEANEGEEEPEYGREFRAIPTAVQGIENNLSIANMGFEDFADAVDEDGVFRDFK
jgi:hypothetical protein